jgi:hypothetical protein
MMMSDTPPGRRVRRPLDCRTFVEVLALAPAHSVYFGLARLQAQQSRLPHEHCRFVIPSERE